MPNSCAVRGVSDDCQAVTDDVEQAFGDLAGGFATLIERADLGGRQPAIVQRLAVEHFRALRTIVVDPYASNTPVHIPLSPTPLPPILYGREHEKHLPKPQSPATTGRLDDWVKAFRRPQPADQTREFLRGARRLYAEFSFDFREATYGVHTGFRRRHQQVIGAQFFARLGGNQEPPNRVEQFVADVRTVGARLLNMLLPRHETAADAAGAERAAAVRQGMR